MNRVRANQIAARALQTRKKFLNAGASNPVCPYNLAESMGFHLRFVDIPSFEGMYLADDDTILIAADRPEGRKCFTCAHEIGHHVLGHGTVIDEIIESGSDEKNELEADFFASMLLMPSSAVKRAGKTIGLDFGNPEAEKVYILSRYLGVSFTQDTFDVDAYVEFLNREMNGGRTLYSNAYMMASGCKEFRVTRKHHAHMLLLEKMLRDGLPQKIQECRTMQEGYDLLLSYPLIGNFLAYQYITGINYSELTDFSETEFTVPGPGARDGIRKCFLSLGGITETELIKTLTERQEYEFERLGLDIPSLGGRKLQYIDIQNVFCETDKYCRIAHPDIQGISGRTKLKQLFRKNDEPIDYFFPPKWGVDMEELHGR